MTWWALASAGVSPWGFLISSPTCSLLSKPVISSKAYWALSSLAQAPVARPIPAVPIAVAALLRLTETPHPIVAVARLPTAVAATLAIMVAVGDRVEVERVLAGSRLVVIVGITK